MNGYSIDEAFDRIDELETENARLTAELSRYQTAEREGRLIALPCNVGQIVCCTNTGKIKTDEIVSFAIREGNTPCFKMRKTGEVFWSMERFNKTVFLTRAAAEAALQKDTDDYPCTDHECYDRGNYRAGCVECDKYKVALAAQEGEKEG